MAKPDANWKVVAQFISDLRNASRLATFVDSVVEVYESKAWRRYTDATGRSDDWRTSEFDYFLIACGADYTDVQRLLTWEKARAADLAAAMESDDPKARRPIEEASASWRSPTGMQLTELAVRQGWTRPTGGLKVSPAPRRARVKAQTGITKDEQTRANRDGKIAEERRRALQDLATTIGADIEEIELRYLIDTLRDQLKARRSRA